MGELIATFRSPGPEIFQLGPFSLRWYGLLIALSVLIGLFSSLEFNTHSGPSIVAAALFLFILSLLKIKQTI